MNTPKYYLEQAQKIHSKWGWAIGMVGLGSLTIVAFGPELKGNVSQHTAEVARRSLENVDLQIQTQQLASEIVQTVLNNPKVLDQAAQFVSHLTQLDATQKSLIQLTKYVLNDPHTLAEVTKVTKRLIYNMMQDPATLQQLVELVKMAIFDPTTKDSVIVLLQGLMQDKTVQAQVTELMQFVFIQEPVKTSVETTMTETCHQIMSNEQVNAHAKVFVSDVLKDQTVQSHGGDALWSTVWYSVTPRWISWIWTNPDTAFSKKKE